LADKPAKTYFVREATGLVKSLTWFDVMVVGLAYFSIAVSAFLIFGLGSYLFPGSNMIVLVSVIGLLFDIPVLIAYGMFSAVMPRSGGDYVYISRTFLPSIGFAASAVFWLYGLTFAGGQNAYFTVSFGLAPYLGAIGSVGGNPGLVSFASSLTQPIPLVAVGTIMLGVLFVLMLVPTSVLHRVLLGSFIVAFAGYPILFVITLAFTSHGAFVTDFNNHVTTLGLNTSYDAIIASAQKAGASLPPVTLAATLAALPLAYATLGVPNSGVYFGGEVKRATRQVTYGLIACLLVIAGSVAAMGYLIYSVFGYNFIAATSYLSNVGGYPLPVAPYVNYFLAIIYPNPAFNWFMLLSVLAWQVIVMALVGLVATRILFAWSFDRVVPSAMSDISQRFHTPVKGAVVVTVACWIFLVATVYNFLGSYVNLVFAQAALYLITMVAATTFPFLKKGIFNQSNSWATKKVGGLPLMSLFGGLGAAVLLVNFYYLFTDPAVSGYSLNSFLIIVATYLLFIAIYYVTKSQRKKEGIDLNYVFAEIPPE
jgi:amino acid transporter